MLRTRFMAAATAAVLMLGISVGGAGAAVAAQPPPPVVPTGVTINYTNGTTCNEVGYTKPPSLDNIEGGTGSATFPWGTFSWSGSVASWTVNPGWTVDLCVKGGNVWPLAEIDLGTYVGTSYTHPQNISHLGYRAVAPVASASATTVARDCDSPTTWSLGAISNATWGTPTAPVGGMFSVVATATNGALFAAGPGVSEDRTTKTFTAPYQEAGGENCAPPLAEAAVTVDPRDCFEGTDLVIDTENSSNVMWGEPVIDEDAGTITIVATAINGALFEDGLEGVSDDRTTRTFVEDYQPAGGRDCEPLLAEAAVTVDPRNCFEGTDLVIDTENSSNVMWGEPVIDEDAGTITIVATANNGALFEDGLEGVSDDRTTRTFTEDYEEAGGEDCVAPAIGVTASFMEITCDDDGWYRFGPGEGVSEADAALLEWSVDSDASQDDNEPGVEHPVSQPDTIVITVSLVESAEGDYALSDETVLGVQDPETGDITYTFTFLAPEDCELDAVVVPDVTYVDECVEEEESDSSNTVLVGVASFTVTKSPNVSYVYTVNGGTEQDVAFPDGEESVTIVVTPGDLVVVTASAAAEFRLPDDYEAWSHEFVTSELCDLPSLANWPASATGSDQVCETNGSLTSGTITVTFSDGPGDSNPVRYYLFYGTPQQEELVDAVTNRAPGSYTVTAVATEPTDSINNAGNTAQLAVTVGAADANCGELETLAFTGASEFTNWVGVAAVLMMLAGMGFVVRRNRVEV